MSIQLARSVVGVTAFIFSGVVFGQTTVPNDFTAGQPARAAEVNENFDTLETAIDQNASDIQAIPAGPQGDVGPTGPPGSQGDVGQQGIQGVQGFVGPPGPQGSQGDTGSQGPQGVQGDTGPQGVVGPPGADLTNEVSVLQGEQVVQNDRIDALEIANTGLQVFSQGVSIGSLLQPISLLAEDLYLISGKGYLFYTRLLTLGGHLLDTTYYFSGSGCTGNVYLDPNPYWVGAIGGVFKSANPAIWGNYYIPRGALFDFYTVNSEFNGAGCNDAVLSGIQFYPAFPNDESVTGVSNSPPVLPLTIGVP